MPRAKQRTPELREHVVAVALAALESDGVAGFTTRRIAADAGTSTPAVYELFGDRAGLVRAVFFEGFARLGAALAAIERSDDPVADLVAWIDAFRAFVSANSAVARVMFSRPFADFDPTSDDLAAGERLQRGMVDLVRSGVDAGTLQGSPVDIAHVIFSVALGLAAQEASGLLGASKRARDRRWKLAVSSVLAGLGASG